jgi:hypothetical protein
MAFNIPRAERMRRLTNAQLRAIVEAKTLSSAAARFELRRREQPDETPPP